MITSPSELACEALGLSPTGNQWPEATICTMCGMQIPAGEIANAFKPASTFMDDAYLAARTGVICGFCSALWTAPVMIATQKVVICRDGVFPIAKDSHRAWFLTDPPEPPFLAVVSDSMRQHLIWKTPISLSRDLLTVRLGHRLLRIRRSLLLQAKTVCADLAALLPKKKSAYGDKRHPFLRLDREMQELHNAVLHPRILKAATQFQEVAKQVMFLQELTPGEIWGLATLCSTKGQPEQPPRVSL